MKKLAVCMLFALAVVVLFPPANRMRPVGNSQMLFDEGYTFIARIGGPVQIRYEEWFFAIGIIGVLSAAFTLCARSGDRCPLPVFWLLASAFGWALVVAPFVRRRIRDLILLSFREFGAPLQNYSPLAQWTTLLIYPAICWTAAVLLTRSRRTAGSAIAIGHFIAGLVWMGYVFLVAYAFGRSFR